jgi:hypothetical protein
MNAKGQADLLVYIFRAILILLLAYLLSVQIGFFTNIDTPTADIEAELIAQRLLYGPASFARKEPSTGASIPGTVDLERLSDSGLLAAYGQGFEDANLWGGKVTLYATRKDLEAETDWLWLAYLNENGEAPKPGDVKPPRPIDILPLARAGVGGSGAGLYFANVYPVRYRRDDDATDRIGWIKIELVKRT